MEHILDGKRYYVDLPTYENFGLTSLHGLVRTMQRMNATQQKALRLIRDAFYKGLEAVELPKRWQRDYIEKERMLMYNGYTKLRVFENSLFIFSGEDKLITMYKLPGDFEKPLYFDKRTNERVRSVRKYFRMHPRDEEGMDYRLSDLKRLRKGDFYEKD